MAKQRPKNELISKNTIANEWIIASNDSISKMKLVEKKLKKHDTSSVVHEIQSLVECIEDIFKKSDIDTQSNILLSNMDLRVQQRDFIRNLMKLLIIYRVLLTNWDNEHFEESAILLAKEVRDSFKKMVRTRKSLHVQFRLDTDTNTNPGSTCRESFEINSQRYADSMSSASNVQQSMTRSSSTESMIIEKYSLPRKCSSVTSSKALIKIGY
ncbi:hypothetical protein K502DRAFT_169929 [Neoconidiobolus thromboides FSU 785]|nr:hypothetical protein K502DRAFT_169929 [Neoconidiobolus thromboides FSU 785]